MDRPAIDPVPRIVVHGAYAGRVQTMPGDSRATAIFKQPLAGVVEIGPLGLAGDQQADRRVHGGQDKAVHQFAAENYARLAQQFPALASQFVPGSLGENLSSTGCDEASVCIGDRYQLGGVVLQLSQPRQPCWKINARYAEEGITEWLAAQGCTGWYYRVLQSGRFAPGDVLRLIERPAGALPLAEFWAIIATHRPSLDALQAVLAAPGLPESWRARIEMRKAWLQNNP